MKMKRILPIIAAAATTAAWAQQQPPATPGTPTPGTPAPPPAALPPGVIAVPSAPEPQPTALPSGVVANSSTQQGELPPPGTKWVGVINGTKVNARGRATIFSHRVFPFDRGERVFVLEEITLSKPKAGDVKKWLRLQIPGNVVLWVHSKYIDPKTKTVTASSLRVRSGYGENYPIVGELQRGERVMEPQQPQRKGNWMGIIAPANTSVYVAAQYVGRAQVASALPSKPAVTPDSSVNKIVSGKPPKRTLPNKVVPSSDVSPKPNNTPPRDIIITVPNSAFDPNQKNKGTPEQFPAPPLPIKQSKPAGLKTSPPKSRAKPPAPQPTTPESSEPKKTSESNKIVKPPFKPEENKKGPEEPAKIVKKVTPPQPLKPAASKPQTEPKESKKSDVSTKAPKSTSEKDKVVAPSAKPPTGKTKSEKTPIRIVTREGVVQRTLNIQAPAPYVLEHIESGKVINYLLLDNPKLPLKLLRGRIVLVSGEEAIDPRWVDTPVLKIKTLKTIDDNQP